MNNTYELGECGYWYDTVEAESLDEALAIARGNVSRGNYPDGDGTLYIGVRVRAVEDHDVSDSDTVVLAPEEPDCADGEDHDWQTPHEIVGGLRENPGCWGHGGGIIQVEVCVHCGCGRKTDTWATRTDTGEQGLTEISYEPGQYADEVRIARTAQVPS